MQLLELACSSMSLYAVQWACMQFNELACSSKSLHAVQWACMQLHKLVCNYVTLHAVTLACMQFHEHACSSLLCLSSEQLTRMSQCLFSFNWKNPKKCCKFLNSFVYLPDSNLHLEPQQKDFYSKFWYFLNLKSFVFFCKQSFAFVCLVFIISA